MKAWLAFYPGDPWALWTLALLAQVTVLLSLASVASWKLERRPAARHTLWLFALAGVMAAPFVALAIRQTARVIEADPSLAVSMQTPDIALAVPSLALGTNTPAPADSVAAPDGVPRRIAKLDQRATTASEVAPPAAPPSATAPTASWPRAIPSSDGLRLAFTVAVFAWRVGGILLLVRLLGGLCSVARLRASGQPCEDFRVLRLAEVAAAGFGLRRRPQLLLSPAAPGPLFLGLRQTTVLLPTELPAMLDDAALTAVLRHEFAHAARGDALVGLLAQFTRAIWWPHPLVWRLCSELGRSREELCDNAALETADRAAYAETLLAVATFRPGGRMPAAGFAFLGPKRSFETRIVNILDRRRSMTTTTTWGVRMGMALLVGAAATLGAWGTRGWASDATEGKAAESSRAIPKVAEPASEQHSPNQASESPANAKSAKPAEESKTKSQFEWDNARRYLAEVETNFNRSVAAEQQFHAVESAHRAGTVTLDLLLDAIRRRAEAVAAYYESMRKVRMSVMEDEFADSIRHQCLLQQLPCYEKGVEDSRQLLFWIVANRPSSQNVSQATEQLELMQDQLKAHKTRIALSEEGMLPEGRTRVDYPVTYSVEDLLDESSDTKEQLKVLGDLLVRTISPDSWDIHGGPGSVSPYEKNRCLIISQTADGHEQVVELLEQIRKLKEPRDGEEAATEPVRGSSK